jgi:short subunit dehydrogenase-like uncharacterized protein
VLTWLLYGAYGTTGRLIVDEGLRRGHRPVIAGRDAAQPTDLQRATGLEMVQVALEDRAKLAAALSGMDCAVLAAGPYEVTGPLMRGACLDARCSCLDLNAAVDDFCQALLCDDEARAAAATVRAVESMRHTHPGAFTPAQAFGADFVLGVPGTQIQELH